MVRWEVSSVCLAYVSVRHAANARLTRAVGADLS